MQDLQQLYSTKIAPNKGTRIILKKEESPVRLSSDKKLTDFISEHRVE